MKWPREEEVDHERAVRVASEFLEDIRGTLLGAAEMLGDLMEKDYKKQ